MSRERKKKRERRKARAILELRFPGLRGSKWKITSRATLRYNCLAWAIGESHRRWDGSDGYWPNTISRDTGIVTLVKAYITKGFTVCQADGTTYDPRFDKIVLYDKTVLYQGSVVEHQGAHAARLMPNGMWSSKIGDWEDIEHPTPESLMGVRYGDPLIYMRREK